MSSTPHSVPTRSSTPQFAFPSLRHHPPHAPTSSETLGPHAALLAHSSSTMPDRIEGVIYANELLDALPTHAVAMTGSGLREVFVDEVDGRFVERFEELSSPTNR